MRATVEILYIEECPNHEDTRALVERAAAELGVDIDVRMVDVETQEDAERLRFVGSPTIRVDGRDVEAGADERTDFARACRVYATAKGFAGRPSETWVREALRDAR